jgi:hypothetical protein
MQPDEQRGKGAKEERQIMVEEDTENDEGNMAR